MSNKKIPYIEDWQFGTCLICGRETNEWWFFDNKTKYCKCNNCLKIK